MELRVPNPSLTIPLLCEEARLFADVESTHPEPAIFGVTDGKAVGTYFEHKFKAYLTLRYDYTPGNAAKGIDFPESNIDMKVTSVKQRNRRARSNRLDKRSLD